MIPMSDSNEHDLYPLGACVTFHDPNGNTCDGQVSLSSGIVNNFPLRGTNGILWVPVFCERDNGREPTTIMVRESNIVATKREGSNEDFP
jgi:hypothetical protein